jgi:hypothetical protein
LELPLYGAMRSYEKYKKLLFLLPNALGSTLCARDDQNNAGGEDQSPSDWRNRNGLLSVSRRLDRTNIEDFFRSRIGDSLRYEKECAKDNEDDAKNRHRFHAHQAARAGPNLNPPAPEKPSNAKAFCVFLRLLTPCTISETQS